MDLLWGVRTCERTMIEQEIACYIVDVWHSTQRGMCGERDDKVEDRATKIEELEAHEGPENLVSAVHGVVFYLSCALVAV